MNSFSALLDTQIGGGGGEWVRMALLLICTDTFSLEEIFRTESLPPFGIPSLYRGGDTIHATSQMACCPLHPYLVRARPKSQILRSQFALTRRFEGLRSRWRMLAEWMYFRPRSTCIKAGRPGKFMLRASRCYPTKPQFGLFWSSSVQQVST